MSLAMIDIGVLAALVSAITQAMAHALLKSGDDKLVIRALIGLTGAVAMAPACALVPWPTPELWPWLAASAAVHAVYQLTLIQAYARQDFAVAYPMARGVAPLATTVLGVALLGDSLTATGLIGIVSVTLGLVALALARTPDATGLVAATLAGLLMSAYTLIDAHGVRLAAVPWTFIAWFFVLDGLVMTTIAVARRGMTLPRLLRSNARTGLWAGVASLATYSTALIALCLLPTGGAAALRETSVVFGAIIAAVVLGEAVGWRRIAGSALVGTGGVLVVLGMARE